MNITQIQAILKKAWPRDAVKESESTTDYKNEPGSEMESKVNILVAKQKCVLS
jgi:hypothetical protein